MSDITLVSLAVNCSDIKDVLKPQGISLTSRCFVDQERGDELWKAVYTSNNAPLLLKYFKIDKDVTIGAVIHQVLVACALIPTQCSWKFYARATTQT